MTGELTGGRTVGVGPKPAYDPLAFAIMVNNFEGSGAQATAAIDAIAVSLAEYSRRRN